jgi:hypothetical protein
MITGRLVNNHGDSYGLRASGDRRTADPQWASDPAVVAYLERMKQYSSSADVNIPNAVWGYATAATMVRTLENMTNQTRQGVMDAIHRLKADDIPMLLPTVSVDGTKQGSAPISTTRLLKFGDGRWSLAATT